MVVENVTRMFHELLTTTADMDVHLRGLVTPIHETSGLGE
jgi:hypothetical protein